MREENDEDKKPHHNGATPPNPAFPRVWQGEQKREKELEKWKKQQ